MRIKLYGSPEHYNLSDDLLENPNYVVEDVVRILCQKLMFRPIGVSLCNLRTLDKIWISPSVPLSNFSKDDVLVFRLCYKIPFPERLLSHDKKLFTYFYTQVKEDFLIGEMHVSSSSSSSFTDPRKSSSLLLPFIDFGANKEIRDFKFKLYNNVVQCISILILADMKKDNKEFKDLLCKNYIPKHLFKVHLEKIVTYRHIKSSVQAIVEERLKKMNSNIFGLMEEFLLRVDVYYSEYFDETFKNITYEKGTESVKISLILRPCIRKYINGKYEEQDGRLLLNYEPYSESCTEICKFDEICILSVKRTSIKESIELSRKNGIPIYLEFSSQQSSYSFLTLLCGYYRLTEKWIFCLCTEIEYPSLEALRLLNSHGPVGKEFISAKFREKLKDRFFSQDSYYILYQDSYNYNQTHLLTLKSFYTIHEINRQKCLISPSLDGKDEILDSLKNVLKWMTTRLGLLHCIHPSEMDYASDLLLCRSEEKRQESILSPYSYSSSLNSSSTSVFISFTSLSRFMNGHSFFPGRVTDVWKGKWGNNIVAIKQLDMSRCKTEDLCHFLEMSTKMMTCQSRAIVKILGFCPPNGIENVALVMDFFELGPLDIYLREEKSLALIDLLEASTDSAHALVHLSELRLVHGNIRAHSFFVHYRDAETFKIKLGDPGIYQEKEIIHWIPPELSLHSEWTHRHQTLEGDIWALGTTLWEFFSYGALPKSRPLPIPTVLSKSEVSSLYDLMCSCWEKDPHDRISPFNILKIINQLFFKVFNSRRNTKDHYVTIDEKDSQISLRNGEFKKLSFPSNMSYSSQSDSNYSSNYTSHSLLSSMSIYTIDSGDLEISWCNPLGQGNFGIVYRGLYTSSNGDSSIVAVKILKDLNPSLVFDIQREVDLMKNLRHENIVRIIGTMSDELKYISIVMEYIQEGSLDKYLLRHKNELLESKGSPLFKFSSDIADGMFYLNSLNIVHRDLAARNVLIVDEERAKITDFGLSRELSNDSDYYVMASQSNIPVKWLALESLVHKKYSSASDVWAFGITLWEMFSFGLTPDLEGTRDFFNSNGTLEDHSRDLQNWIAALASGIRLPRPNECPSYVYSEIMLPCWNSDVKARPSFTSLKTIIKKIELKIT